MAPLPSRIRGTRWVTVVQPRFHIQLVDSFSRSPRCLRGSAEMPVAKARLLPCHLYQLFWATPRCVPASVNCRWSTSPRPTTSFATTHKHGTICTSISRDNTPIYPISYLQSLLAGQRSLMLASPQMRILSVSIKPFNSLLHAEVCDGAYRSRDQAKQRCITPSILHNEPVDSVASLQGRMASEVKLH